MRLTNRMEGLQVRNITTNLETREEEDNGKIFLEGYFVVFNRETKLWEGAYEEIDSLAFNNTMNNDIRALINHDTTLVLGRNKSNTLQLKADEKGLWGKVEINKDDTDAMNIYQRVKRGDVSGNSFGFNILDEVMEERDDGSVKWIIRDIDLHEVSITTFPAYEETTIQARCKQLDQHNKRRLDIKKEKLKERINNVKTINDK